MDDCLNQPLKAEIMTTPFKITTLNSKSNHPFNFVYSDYAHIAEIARVTSVHLGRVTVEAHDRTFRVYEDGLCVNRWYYADFYDVSDDEDRALEREIMDMHEKADAHEARCEAKGPCAGLTL